MPTDPVSALAAKNAAVAAVVGPPSGFDSDPEIEKLCIFGNAKLAAYTIRQTFGKDSIKFTSGFRPIEAQIKAMSTNQAEKSTFLFTYAGAWQKSDPPDTWPADAQVPKDISKKGYQWKKWSAKPIAEMFKWAIESGETDAGKITDAWLKIVMDSKYTMADRLAISKHSGGIAFDIQPLPDGSTANDIIAFIGKDDAAGSGNLAGKERFLTKEAGLIRWHVQFTRDESDISYDDLLLWYDATRAKPGKTPPPAQAQPIKPEPKEEDETSIIAAGYSWSKPLGKYGKVEFELALTIDGDLVYTGPKEEAPDADSCKAQLEDAGNEKSKVEFEAPIAEGLGHPRIEAGKDFHLFTKEWGSKKGKSEVSMTVGEIEIFCVKFDTPGWKEPLLAIPIMLAATEINLKEPLESSIGKLSGSLEVTVVDGEIQLTDHLKIKGGLGGELGASFELLSAEDLLKDALGDAWDVVEGLVADGAEEATAEVAAEEGAAIAGADIALTVGAVVVGVAAIAYVCYEIFESWEQSDAKQQLQAAEDATVDGFMDGLTAQQTNLNADGGNDGFDQASYLKAFDAGTQQRNKLIADKCNGDASHLDNWLIGHMQECMDEVIKQFRKSARKTTFEKHAKPRTGSMFDNSLSTLRDWWQATILGDPKSTGMMDEWEKYRGSEPGDGWFSDSDEITWKGDWSSL